MRQTNWSQNHVYVAERLLQPRSVEELCEAVAGAQLIRALGSRHSFTDLADTTGSLVSLQELPVEIDLDADAGSVRVSAGVTYGQLSLELHKAGWALASMASLPHITVAGAVATGTHGSGEGLGSLSSAVSSIELVGPDGERRTVRRGEPDFAGHVVSLGALGIATHLTLDVEPTFEVRQDVLLELAWDDLGAQFDTLMSSAYSVSVFTDWVGPTVTQAWFKSRTDQLPAPPAAGELPGPVQALVVDGALPATAISHMLLGAPEESLTTQLGESGPWHERLPHFRQEFTPSRGAELQSEYFVPRRHAAAAIEALRGVGPQLGHLLQVGEIRIITADELWLSGAYGEDAVGFHFTWELDVPAVYDVLPILEGALRPFGVRAHWGKCFTLSGADLRPAYPRLGDFVALRDAADPDRKFGNAFLERYLD
jgi:xylitol oxidase